MEQTAEVQIRRLNKKRTFLAVKYINAFNALAAKIEWNNLALLSQFKANLGGPYKAKIQDFRKNKPKSLKEYQNAVRKLAKKEKILAGRAGAKGAKFSLPVKYSTAAGKPINAKHDRMDTSTRSSSSGVGLVSSAPTVANTWPSAPVPRRRSPCR